MLTIADHLTGLGQLERIGGVAFLAEVAEFEATAANVRHHAQLVRDKALRRRLIETATEIVRTGFEWSGPGDALLEEAESKIFELSQQQSSSTFRSMHDELPDTFNYVDDIMHRAGQLTGCPRSCSRYPWVSPKVLCTSNSTARRLPSRCSQYHRLSGLKP